MLSKRDNDAPGYRKIITGEDISDLEAEKRERLRSQTVRMTIPSDSGLRNADDDSVRKTLKMLENGQQLKFQEFERNGILYTPRTSHDKVDGKK